MNVAVIMFPGTNCEDETKRALESAGMPAEIIRWNTGKDLSGYDGFVIPGGWSYEDRIRAGAISAQDPIMKTIKKEAKQGKPVLGICNGAQVLVETGMVPGVKMGEVQMALAPNINPEISGYYCTWVRVKSAAEKGRCAFNAFIEKGAVLPIPIAHGEGRFTTAEDGLLKKLIDHDQIVFRYCDPDGDVTDGFPVNPNGSVNNAAAVCNSRGNVMAIMPHPERANWNRQMPGFESRSFKQMESPAPCRAVFRSMRKYIEGMR